MEFTDQFGEWWDTLTIDTQAAIDAAVEALQERGPALGRPSLFAEHLAELETERENPR